ncbi:MAG: hypothetical protein ACI9VM_001010 [Candidatus Azotimanducaceae bacterium]|jgi:hypothetical protein
MKKIEVQALVVGAISGVPAYYVYDADLVQFPGLVFGIFCIPFFWYYVRTMWRVFLWVGVSGLSFIVAVLTAAKVSLWILTVLLSESVWVPVVGYAAGGFVGAIILLLGFRFLVGVFPRKYEFIILLNGTALPALLGIIFGSSGGFLSEYVTDPLTLVLMVLWQASMLYWFVYLLQLGKDDLKTLSQEPQ